MAKFRSGDELAMMLGRALQIEISFENEAQWEGYYEKEKLRNVLMELIVDSARHAETVKELMAMVKMTPGMSAPPIHAKPFNFRGKNDLEMMMEMGKTERLMRDLYTDIMEAVKSSPPGLLVEETDMDKFLADLDFLVKAEVHHADLVASYVGKVERIR